MKEKMHIAVLSLGICTLIGMTFAISVRDYKEKTPKLNSAPEATTSSKKFECTKEAVSEKSPATKEYKKNLDKLTKFIEKFGDLGGNTSTLEDPCTGLKGKEKAECNINNVELRGLLNQIKKLEEKIQIYENCAASFDVTITPETTDEEKTTKEAVKETKKEQNKKANIAEKEQKKVGVDFEFKNITHRDGEDKYTYRIDFCVHGNKSIDDLKKNFPELQNGLPLQYTIIGDDNKVLIKEPLLKISLNANKIKNSDCFNEIIKIYTPDLEKFDIAKKVIFEVDQDNIIKESNEKNNIQELYSKDFCKTISCQTTHIPTQKDINFDMQMKNGGFTITGPIEKGKHTSEVMIGSNVEFYISDPGLYGTFTYLCGKDGEKITNPDLPSGELMGVFYCTYDKIGTKTVSIQRNGKIVATKSFKVIEKKDSGFPCKDSENGQDKYTQGSVTGLWYGQENKRITNKMDQCKDSNTLYEYYCTEKTFRGDEPVIYQEEYTCENGCIDGACRKEELEISVSVNTDKEYIYKTYNQSSFEIPFTWQSNEPLYQAKFSLTKDNIEIYSNYSMGMFLKGGSEVLNPNGNIKDGYHKIQVCEIQSTEFESDIKSCSTSKPFKIITTSSIEN